MEYKNDSWKSCLGEKATMVFRIGLILFGFSCLGALSSQAAEATIAQVTGGWFANNFMARMSDGTVWEFTSAGIDPSPVQGVSNIIAISQSNSHSLALKNDGTVWGWGDNEPCNLFDGNGYYTIVDTPIQVGGFTNVKAISAGWQNTMVVKNDGTVWGLGKNNVGQLGDGTTTQRCAPVHAIGLNGVTALSTKGMHTVALKDDGTVWTWGWNTGGQLGDGTYNDHYIPAQVPGLSGVVAIAAGGRDSVGHTVALKSDGTVWVWGWNNNGQLGDGTTINRPTPIQVPGLSGIIAISAGAWDTLALKNNGTVWRWGNCRWNESQPIPQQVSGLSGVIAIASGYFDSLCLKNDNTVWTWSAQSESIPVQVADDTILTINFTDNGNGSVSLSTGGSCSENCDKIVHRGTPIILTPSAGTDSTFVSWSGCDLVEGNQCTVTMDAAKSVTAQFKLQAFTVTSVSSGNGSITPSSTVVNYNGEIPFNITPNSGYTLDKLLDNGVDVTSSAVLSTPTTFAYNLNNIRANHALQVSFKTGEMKLTVTSVSSGNGTITPSSTVVYHNGFVPFIITPNSGYTLDKLLDNGVDVTSSAVLSTPTTFAYDLMYIRKNHALQASFRTGEIPIPDDAEIPLMPPPALLFWLTCMGGIGYRQIKKRKLR
jgi:alpha-tubulin suppressor-like RCC1 family protein